MNAKKLAQNPTQTLRTFDDHYLHFHPAFLSDTTV